MSRAASSSLIADAIIPLATYYQFSPGENIAHPRVQSRMLLWCKAGAGVVRVNGRDYDFRPDDFLLLPWKHSVGYRPDDREPMFVGGLHIVPSHARGKKIVHEIAHRADDPLADVPWRRDVPLRGLDGVQRDTLVNAPALRHLAEYAIQRLSGGHTAEWEERALAQLLLAALIDHFNTSPRSSPTLPIDLQRMVQFVQNHLHQKISLEHVAAFAQLSPSAVGRMFRKHLRVTPVTYITQAKIKYAQQLLSTSRLSVGEIGRRVGIDDPYYFSKLFSKTAGCSPLAYRKKATLL